MSAEHTLALFQESSFTQPLIWGVNDLINETIEDLNLTTAAITKNFATVPAGYLYVYTNTYFRYVGTSPTLIVYSLMDGANEIRLWSINAAVTNTGYDRNGFYPVKAGNNLRLSILNGTASNDIFAYVSGYSMKVGK